MLRVALHQGDFERLVKERCVTVSHHRSGTYLKLDIFDDCVCEEIGGKGRRADVSVRHINDDGPDNTVIIKYRRI